MSREMREELIETDLEKSHPEFSPPGQVVKQAKIIDTILVERFQKLRANASAMILQIHNQKSGLLNRYDMWLMPMAQEVFNQMLDDAKHLHSQLDQTIDGAQSVNSDSWIEKAKALTQLYNKLQNHTGLTDQILEIVSQRTASWIDKDFQVIQDYKKQSIAHLSQDSEEFKDLDDRLTQAIAEPLKQLLSLRQENQKHESLKQASEWLASFQSKRESCFDNLLMKIDSVVQEIVQIEEFSGAYILSEIEGEILFMEREFQHLHQIITQSNVHTDKNALQLGLENLLEHIEQFIMEIPKQLSGRVLQLKELIQKDLLLPLFQPYLEKP